MENKHKTPEKSLINLKQLPPLDPEKVTNISSKLKPSPSEGRTPVEYDERTKASESHITEPKNLENADASFGSGECKQISTTRRKKTKKKTASNNEGKKIKNKKGAQERQGKAKSELHEICAANKWKPPLFQWCMDEGPSHMKMYTFKVMVEIREASSSTDLECFSALHSRKQSAINHAAEGALWCLKHLGYFSKNS